MAMFDLSGKVALVTGGSRGIGRAISLALASQGAYVAVNFSQGAAAAEETLRVIKAAGGDGEVLGFDVSNAEAVTDAVEGLVKRKGSLGIAVANAGIAIDGLLLRLKEEDLARTMAVNVNGALFLAKAAIRPMMKARWGRLIMLSSVVGEAGNPGQVAYAASKGALLSVVKSLAKEYASRGITANAITPGLIETEMTAGMPAEYKAKMIESTPVGRAGTGEDVAAAVVYLASREASFVTGQTLRVNGGLYV